MIEVLNFRDLHEIPEGMLYIGRANSRYQLPESKWANPFHWYEEKYRASVLGLYRQHFLSTGDLSTRLRQDLPELEAYSALVCWCAPRRCHGNFLVEQVAELQALKERGLV